jgi:hypothetical protein
MAAICVVPDDLFLDDDESNFYLLMAYASALKFQSSLPGNKFTWSVASCRCHFIFNVTKDLLDFVCRWQVLHVVEA